ncbi:MAG: lysylphosphatidylglycerol synthase domain-containing protein [Planctomycetota bacterium]
MKARLRTIVGPVMAVALFALAVRLLYRESQKVTWDDFVAGVTGVDISYLVIAAVLVSLNYGLLTCYDMLALRYVRRPLPLRRVMLAGFLGFALGNNLGTLLAAAPIRYRFYHRWGLSHGQIMAVMTALALTFWSGLATLGGIVLVIAPIELPDNVALPFGTRTLGFLLLGVAIAYAVLCSIWRTPKRIGSIQFRLPAPGLAGTQASIAAVDLLISATTLYLVLPSEAVVPFSSVLAAFLVAITVSILTQVPGGLGVLELILWTLLKDTVGESLFASVFLFRLIYYIIPLLFGMVTLMGHEIYSGAVEARIDRERESAGTVSPSTASTEASADLDNTVTPDVDADDRSKPSSRVEDNADKLIAQPTRNPTS